MERLVNRFLPSFTRNSSVCIFYWTKLTWSFAFLTFLGHRYTAFYSDSAFRLFFNRVPVNYDPPGKYDSTRVIKQVVDLRWLLRSFFSFWAIWVVKSIHCQRNVSWMVIRQRILTRELDVLSCLNWVWSWKWISVVIAGRLTSLLPPVLIIFEKNV